MFHILLIILFSFDLTYCNHPILIAKPYPFNRSESSRIECFSNDQGILLSLTILTTMIDEKFGHSSLQSSENNLTKNGSIILTIAAPFNYSQLNSKIECRSKYHHGEQQIDQLDVLSVVEIPQKELLAINTYTKQMVSINCLTYGTNTFVQWNFSKDLSQTWLGSLPIGIHMDHRFTINDTLIIDHVSYADHHGYYRCYAMNRLLGRIYEDSSVIYLNVKKNTIWIPIVIACLVIGVCILTLILCSKYYQRKRKKQIGEISDKVEDMMEEIKQISSNDEESAEFISSNDRQRSSDRMEENIDQSGMKQERLPHFEHSNKSSTIFSLTENEALHGSSISTSFLVKKSPQFILSNPFLDLNVRLIPSMRQHTKKLK